MQDAWNKVGDSVTRLASIKEKIGVCGAEIKAWGAAKTDLDAASIKQLQNRFDNLNRSETTNNGKAKYLEVSKRLDDLLLKQEIYWA